MHDWKATRPLRSLKHAHFFQESLEKLSIMKCSSTSTATPGQVLASHVVWRLWTQRSCRALASLWLERPMMANGSRRELKIKRETSCRWTDKYLQLAGGPKRKESRFNQPWDLYFQRNCNSDPLTWTTAQQSSIPWKFHQHLFQKHSETVWEHDEMTFTLAGVLHLLVLQTRHVLLE